MNFIFSFTQNTSSLLILALLCLFTACEDPIDLDSSFTDPQLVVDAWLDDQSREQVIILSFTQDIFKSELPQKIDVADVRVMNGDTEFTFEAQGQGRFVWTPQAGETLGTIGDRYELFIDVEGNSYRSETMTPRVPAIDSIGFQYEEGRLGLDDGIYAQLYARDLPEPDNTYWIRTWHNDTLLGRPREMVLAYDAAFSPGSGANGIPFIFPLRFGINKLDDDGFFVPLQSGDKVRCELLGITQEALRYLTIAQEQMLNGDNGIFALPVANAPGNIQSVSGEETVLGRFHVASVSQAERVVD